MKKQISVALLSGALALTMLGGCSSASNTSSSANTNSSSNVNATATNDNTTDAAVSVDDAAGFTEYPIFEGAELGDYNGGHLLTMNGVYFQAVPMTGGYEDTSNYNIHIEADISAEEGNTLGFGAGDWIPYLTVTYDIVNASDGSEVTQGSFMPMSASDGPHYGANVKLDPGTYNITISISPQEDVYLIHTDAETGPAGGGHSFDDYFSNGALTYTYENWDFAGLEQ